ncbi:MAG: response regulator transcription factor [Candidatus Dormiibacterota bacterium]
MTATAGSTEGRETGDVRILIVEDESPLAYIISRLLREEGFSAAIATDGPEGLELALRDRPDAIVLDLQLPGMDGLDVCRRLRAEGSVVPVIMLTARDGVPDRVRGLDAGADDYLVKPFALEELLARIRAQLRRTGRDTERLQVADLVLEPGSRRAWRAGRELTLTAQEWSLLELLLRHPGQVMTRQRILDHVWGYAAAPASNVVDLYIHYLREKIDRDAEQPLIHTVRAVGYVLRP